MDTIFFYASKILWMLIAPDHLLLLLLTLGFLLWISKWKPRTGQVMLALSLAFAWLIAVLPIADWLIAPLENRFVTNPRLPEKVDGILLLGGSILRNHSEHWQQLETNSSHERIAYFIRLAQRYPEAKLVFSGGSASLYHRHPSEASILSDYLANTEIGSRLIFEGDSRNTYENARNSFRRLQPSPDSHWILVTSAFHMPRAVGVFCQQGWKVLPFPVDHHSGIQTDIKLNFADRLGMLSMTTREWLGLIAYRVTGKTAAMFPGDCNPSQN